MSDNSKVGKAKGFNAVDMITVVVFAAMFRVLWIIFKLFGVVYPFNHAFIMLCSAFALVACMVIVKKRYASVLYTIAWCAINFFLQGEIPMYFLCIILLPLPLELYMAARSKSFGNPDDVFHSRKDLIISSIMYNTVYFVFNFVMIIYVFMIPTPMNLILATYGLAIVTMIVGSYLGYQVGYKIKGLIN
jgi:hypothetical protein